MFIEQSFGIPTFSFEEVPKETETKVSCLAIGCRSRDWEEKRGGQVSPVTKGEQSGSTQK